MSGFVTVFGPGGMGLTLHREVAEQLGHAHFSQLSEVQIWDAIGANAMFMIAVCERETIARAGGRLQ